LFAAVLTLGLVGCASVHAPVDEVAFREGLDRERIDRANAAFYWPYAALAADVYRSAGQADSLVPIALGSLWLRREVHESGSDEVVARYQALGVSEAKRKIGGREQMRCAAALRISSAVSGDEIERPAGRAGCADERPVHDPIRDDDQPLETDERFVDQVPQTPEACDIRAGTDPAVPVEVAMEVHRWERVPEFHRVTPARGWSIFVPHLAIDVWRRPRPADQGRPVVEYAIVYRGTLGTGGWVSNLRALTAFTPLVWDQYRQAARTTELLVRQIYQLHGLSDSLFERPVATRVLITTVGHSLGAGLAQYIYLRQPEITRMVGFNPSPVNGASTLPLKARPIVMGGYRHPIDAAMRDAHEPDAAMHLLYERGEVLSRVAACVSGPLWGDEGGPRTRCDSVDLSGGSWFRQHNMAQMACRLYLAQAHLPYRKKRQEQRP
jgi:pimeloyl-ACP methyl ester carboxylesterase